MILRLAGGDGNAIFGLVGFAAGILTGTFFLKKGYTLKRSYKMPKLEGAVYPAFQIVVLILLVSGTGIYSFYGAGRRTGSQTCGNPDFTCCWCDCWYPCTENTSLYGWRHPRCGSFWRV